VSQTSGATRRLWDTKAPSARETDGLASQARETDGDGAPIFMPEFPKADPYQFGKGRVERSLNQIVKKVGTPRRRCPKHQAQRADSGIQRRLQPPRCATTAWQVRRETRTATARHPYQFGKMVTPAFALRDYGLASQSARHGRRRRANLHAGVPEGGSLIKPYEVTLGRLRFLPKRFR